jgi:hypothetical protein
MKRQRYFIIYIVIQIRCQIYAKSLTRWQELGIQIKHKTSYYIKKTLINVYL